MAEPVEVAIEKALVDRLIAMTISPSIPVSLPNVTFIPPNAGPNVYWLRGSFLPADSFALGVDFGSHNQHYGIFQVDVFYGQGSGEYKPGRIASALISWFERGLKLTQDGFVVNVLQKPYRSRMIKDDPWVMISVSIPYRAFARNPA